MSILITSANSAAAHQLKNKLNADDVIMGDDKELPEFLIKSGKMIRLPGPNSASYAHQMLTLCLDSGITTIYPLRDEEKMLLLETEQLFKEYNIDIYL
jgi:hypothetical protein